MRMPGKGKGTAIATTLACALVGLVSSRAIGADDYPSRPVTVVVPYTPGGSTDITGRYDADVLQRALHGSFVVENRPGAGSAIGIGYVAKSAPDGYTLLNAPTSLVLLPYLMKSISYEPAADLDPIVLVGLTEFTLVVSPSLDVNSVAELIALAKAKPGALTYASPGIGSTHHLFGELFKSMAHVDIRHIPYKGAAPGLLDVAGGNVSMMFADLAPALPLIQGRQAQTSRGDLAHAQQGHARCADHCRDRAGLRSERLAGPVRTSGHAEKHRGKNQRRSRRRSEAAGNRQAFQGHGHRSAVGHAGRVPRLHRRRERQMGQRHPRGGHRAAVTSSPRLRSRSRAISSAV